MQPVVLACPYLPLREAVEFAGWWLGPLDGYEGPWSSTSFQSRARQFLASFRQPGDGPIEKPALLARKDSGVDGELPSDDEINALRSAISFGTVDANPFWTEDTRYDAWRMATADNADLWIQPIDVDHGHIALERGGRVRVLSGGHRLDEGFTVPAPLELHMPLGVRLDAEMLEAVYKTILDPPTAQTARARRIATAVHWVIKSWQNSTSLSEEDRLVFLKTASEALTGTSKSVNAARGLRVIFEGATGQEGGGIGIDALLWSPQEPVFTRTRAGTPITDQLSALAHWYLALADTRNRILHEGSGGVLVYSEPGSPYVGPLTEVGDRVFREAIAVELGACGHPVVWRRGIARASFAAWRDLGRGRTETGSPEEEA